MSVIARALRPAAGLGGDGTGGVYDWPWSGSPPEWWLRGTRASSLDTAVGAPALLGVILRLCAAAFLCPFIVYRSLGEDLRERARDSQAWDLLHDGGLVEDFVPARLWADGVASLAGTGNFYARKVVVRGDVVELIVRDPRRVKPRRTRVGEVVFDDTTEGKETVTRREMFHARLASVPGGLEGIAPIAALRRTLEGALDRQDMEVRVNRNNAAPGLAVKWPGPLTQTQADEWIEGWEARHSGEKLGSPTIVPAGTDIQVIPINLADLQFVEQTKMTRESIGGVYGIPLPFLGDERAATYEDRIQFATFCVGGFLEPIRAALIRDRDIFPRGEALSGEFLLDALLKTSTKERYEAYRLARQGGWVKANELRARENLPPAEGGDEIQQTPVGGAPNPDRSDRGSEE